jgi:hypothetical protein
MKKKEIFIEMKQANWGGIPQAMCFVNDETTDQIVSCQIAQEALYHT